MTCWDINQVKHRHTIRGRVVLGWKKPGVLWDDQTVLFQNCSNVQVIGHRGKHASIRVTMASATGTTVQSGIIGIIVRLASMAAHHHKPSKVLGESDHTQAAFHKVGLFLKGKALG